VTQPEGRAPTRTSVADGRLEPPKLGLRDRYVRNRRTTHLAWRIAVGVVGTLVIALGIVLLPLPGPGWLVIFAGLAILASEFAWAERLLHYARDKVLAWTRWVNRQPIPIRLLVGLACAAVVAGALFLYLVVFGIPTWLPDSTQRLLDEVVP
jgi:uncharacterized protein (TIGR02611 family)